MTLSQLFSALWPVAIAGVLMVLMQPFAAPVAAPAKEEAVAVAAAQATGAERALIVPVANTPLDALADTWGDARGEGRTHEGIDIMAPAGAAVLAAVDGRIVKFFDSERGGITIYQFDTRERFVYYYAHLSSRAADLAEGDEVRQGDVIGYVGMTGNAPVPHLHFEIQRLGPEKRWWVAESLDPYPFLIRGEPPAS